MDHASGSPVDKRVIETMMPYFTDEVGNPASLHTSGMNANIALEDARENVADFIGADSSKNIIFTSSGTESNNLALRGLTHRKKSKGKHIITTSIEHMSVLNTCKDLQHDGFEVSVIPVGSDGMMDVDAITEAVTDETILISAMYANGEIGTIQPIREIGEMAHDYKITFHVDAVAACGKIPIDVEKDNIDLLSMASNDLYGPRGVGTLYVKSGVPLRPQITGGGQEHGMRSGSENIAGIVGFSKACEIAKAEMKSEGERLIKLRDRLIDGILGNIDYSYITGHNSKRLPNNASVRFSFIEGESIILGLNAVGVEASTGSACSVKTLEPSHVLIAIGLKQEEAHGSLLMTLGRQNTDADVDHVLENIPAIVARLRAMSPLYPGDKHGSGT